jgi:hypothetical protein
MIRNALLLCAALLAAVCSACAPPPPPIVAAPPPPPPLQVCDVNNENSFIPSKVFMLNVQQGAYDPTTFGDPPAVAIANLPSSTVNDLTQAFKNAPLFFRQHLCNLNGVFIDPTACSGPDQCSLRSWGFRDPRSGRMYIGVSQNFLWPGGAPASRLTEYETTLLQWQLASLDTGLQSWGTDGPPFFSSRYDDPVHNVSDPGNTSAMTVLAALAHELGHVRWYTVNVPVPGSFTYDWKYLIPCPNTNQSFFDESWDYPDSGALQQTTYWRYPLDVAPSSVSHLDDPQNANIKAPGSVAALRYDVARLHNVNHPWASLQASLTPDHDFVETYVFNVLTHNGKLNPPASPYVQSLLLTVPGIGYSPDVPYDYFTKPNKKAKFVRKVSCIDWINQNVPLIPAAQAYGARP